MPTPDPSNVLFKIAHPDLYERNPFNVLNLPVNATAKDVRRRKEDIEAAFDAGTEAEEFRNMLPGDDDRKTPTRAEVDELFSVLEDPEMRIAYSLFWFWPDASETPGGARRRSNPNGEFGHSSVIAKWEEKARGSSAASSSPTVAKHNLSVFHHMMGLAYELALRKYDIRTADTPADVPQHWKAAIYWWNDVSGQADFWHAVSENVSALADPRLDYRFARALRDQFAFAFDQINVELAIDFAKRGREADAKRQVEYMKLSQPDSDDVEGTFDDAFAGLLRQTETIVKTARNESQMDPKNGLKKANEILSRTNEPLSISRIILNKGTPIRNAIVSSIFSGVRNCLLIYGNATNDWKNCIEMTQRLLPIAETSEQKAIASKDVSILTENYEHEKTISCCIKCGRPVKNLKAPTCDQYRFEQERFHGIKNYHGILEVHMHGNLRKGESYGRVRYQTGIIAVPVCPTCIAPVFRANNHFGSIEDILNIQCRMIPISSGGYAWNDCVKRILAYPPISERLASGWRFGETVTDEEIQDIWGIKHENYSGPRILPGRGGYLPLEINYGRRSGCLIFLTLAVGLLFWPIGKVIAMITKT